MRRTVWTLCALVSVLIVAGVAYFVLGKDGRLTSGAVQQSGSAVGPRTGSLVLGLSSGVKLHNYQIDSNEFHLYSPLQDPPPVASAQQLRTWRLRSDWDFALRGMLPDLTKPPLAMQYSQLASSAEHGDLVSAVNLYKGLFFCNGTYVDAVHLLQRGELSWLYGSASAEHVADGVVYGPPTTSVGMQAWSNYCSGLSQSQRDSEQFWAALAIKARNPYVDAHVALDVLPRTFGSGETASDYVKLATQLNDFAAQNGIAAAWMRESAQSNQARNQVRAYADLYTAYMLSHSSGQAFLIWQMSTSLTPFQISDAINTAKENYRKIEEGEK